MQDDPNMALAKDLAEQLRTIQFALLALCLGAVALLTSTSESELERAENQVEAVYRFSADWNGGKGLVDCAVKAIPGLKGEIPVDESTAAIAKPLGENKYPGHNLDVMFSFLLPRLSSPLPDVASSVGGFLDSPKDLEQASALFNALSDVEVVYPIYPGPVPTYDDGGAYDFHSDRMQYFESPTFISRIDDFREHFNVHIYATAEGRASSEYDNALLKDASYRIEHVGIEARQCFPSLLSVQPRLLMPFKSAFPDLSMVTSDLQHVRLDDLRLVLHKLTKTASIEVLGTKIEGVSAGATALVVLLIIEVYFVVHLIALRRTLLTLNAPVPVAWFGLYSERSARVLFFCAQVLPVVIVTLLAHRLWKDSGSVGLLLASALVAAVFLMTALFVAVLRNRIVLWSENKHKR